MSSKTQHERADTLRGMCEQLYDFNISRGHGLKVVYEKLREMNVYSFRAWMHLNYILSDYKTINEGGARYFHKIYASLADCGIEHIVAMSHKWFLDDPKIRRGTCMHAPGRDMRAGSKYLRFLDMFEKSWETAAREFPEITYWEPGNECNHDVFLAPAAKLHDRSAPPFSHKEKIDIMTDMMFRACRGIKSVNPGAILVMPGLTSSLPPKDGYIAQSVDMIYDNIESGDFGSKNITDFFDILGWHPYCPADMSARDWKDYNDSIFSAAVKHNDGNRKVYFTEFGFTDVGREDNDNYLADVAIQKYRIVRDEMPYVESVHAFRLFDDYAAYAWGKNFEKYFGFYRDTFAGCSIKARGITLKNLYHE